jgi:Ni/Fe-hydrogenase 1 B-type cytochrome subunit
MTTGTPRPPGRLPWFEVRLPRARGDITWIYVWGAPLRFSHWLSAVTLLVLFVTGLFISFPMWVTSGEASSHFLMGRFRFVHYTAAAFLVFGGIIRVYWMFAGNQFERWSALFPFTRQNVRHMVAMLKSYVTLDADLQPHFVGRNPLAQVAYTTIYVLTTIMIVTGFAMYGQSNPGGFFHTLFGWVPPLVGGLQHVRLLHHSIAWFYPIFFFAHIYLAIRSDYLERAGVVSSMLTGGRFVASHEKFEDCDLGDQPAAPWHTGEHPVWIKEP